MMERALDLLKGSYWKIDVARFKLSQAELDFLSIFFNIETIEEIDDLTDDLTKYLILRKKNKYLSNPFN